MVSSVGGRPTLPAPRERADFDGCFRIHRDTQHLVCSIGRLVELGYLVEDRVGLRDFF